jgi:hypothetical protein
VGLGWGGGRRGLEVEWKRRWSGRGASSQSQPLFLFFCNNNFCLFGQSVGFKLEVVEQVSQRFSSSRHQHHTPSCA